MALSDRITFETLYNPYILIEGIGPGNDLYATINTSTFKPLQNFLIFPFDDKNISEFVTNKHAYKVFSTISLPNHAFDYNGRKHLGGGLRISGPILSQTLLAFVTEEDLREHLPEIFKNS